MDVINPVTTNPTPPKDTSQSQSGAGRRWRLPGKIADGYLFSQSVESTFRGLLWFAGLLMAFAIITATRKVVDSSIDFNAAMLLIIYQLPRILLFTLPMAVLYGTVQTFSDLSSKGEVTAFWAGGMSFPRMLRPVLLWTIILAVAAFWIQENVVPVAEQKKNDLMMRQVTESTTIIKNLNKTITSSDGSSTEITADEFDPKHKTLLRPVLHVFNPQRLFVAEISAQRAEWNPQTGLWKFYNGQTKNWPSASNSSTLKLNTNDGNFPEAEFKAAPPENMTNAALTLNENLEKANFEMVSIAELQLWRSKLEDGSVTVQGKDSKKFIEAATFGIHDKIATPLICFALVLVGAPLGIRPQRSSGGFSMGISLAVLLLYYVVWTWVSQIGKAGASNPYLLAYFPFVVTFIVGVVLVAKKSR